MVWWCGAGGGRRALWKIQDTEWKMKDDGKQVTGRALANGTEHVREAVGSDPESNPEQFLGQWVHRIVGYRLALGRHLDYLAICSIA